jgi:hypothetical protein
MSATLPPTAGLDRPSDFGAFWQQGDTAPQMHSVAPEVESDAHALTPAQNARRKRLQVVVAGVITGLLAFTALAAIVYVVKRHNEAAFVIASAAANPAPATLAAAPTGAAQLAPAPPATTPSESDGTVPLGMTLAPIARQTSAHTSQLGAPARPHASVARPKPPQTRPARSSSRKVLSR